MTNNTILCIAHNGAARRDLPEYRYCSWKTVYSSFSNWRDIDLLIS
ncbi:transposase, partial [Enterococcus sp. S181_ASV_20]|nr:transposase [Enterococcus sp. S181_ASV_20]